MEFKKVRKLWEAEVVMEQREVLEVSEVEVVMDL